ncbi:DUF1793-domain-containing protein [Coniophora puteana RWD-64-598 SS2]|uniref:DUF1793-domain-containing protein n=1 Tax=Coniophora puteana (strain RWD-64-598) TaxID=741705 RepID=A0A5M3MHN5_CONPW|nr:DUF1793-domain-containing protein [Coniophora puteana RWD-64-598 SS2]EIW78712.1 DUF1793-domain-containing protein [Coniophora puteana RWD-64-598 SS2]
MGLSRLLSFASLAFLATSVVGQPSWTSDPAMPPSVPLAVRSPYLSAWLSQGPGNSLAGNWPQFWTGSFLGWTGYVAVDGTVYTWMGAPAVPNLSPALAVQKSMTYTSTQSTFVLSAGPIDLTVNFLSPVEPTDLVKLGTPFSYMALSAVANDGGSHSVAIYSDITAEWAVGDTTQIVNWTSTTAGDVWTHQVGPQNPILYTEFNDHTQYGAAYFSTQSSVGATWQTGGYNDVRAQFINNGVLINAGDPAFRAAGDNWPVFAFSHTLGTVGTTATDPLLFTIGHVRDPAAAYVVAGGGQVPYSTYFWSKYGSVLDAINDFVADYSTALSDANTFDAKVKSDASAISDHYYALVALTIRQAFGGLELTLGKNSDGSWNTDNPYLFLKEISSDGNMQTVDVMFPMWPLVLYTNPTLGKYLLKPLLDFQATGIWTYGYAVHDLGQKFPDATGYSDETKVEKMPVEESGNMLIMLTSYVQATNDTSMISSYISALETWTDYLTTNALTPGGQLSTDDFEPSPDGGYLNQTNLAIKAAVAIKGMSIMEGLIGNTDKQSQYSDTAAQFSTFIVQTAMDPSGQHLNFNYGNSSSWLSAYNLWADKLLQTNVFPQSVIDTETAWYKTQVGQYGLALDSREPWSKTDWQLWTAAFVSDVDVRNSIIDGQYAYLTDGNALNMFPYSDLYETGSGAAHTFGSQPFGSGITYEFQARPVVGGHLALLVA